MNKIMRYSSLLLLAAGLCGCGTTAKFIYPAQGQKLTRFSEGSPACPKKVAVTPFKDMRGDENQSGTYFLYLIPLMPYGYANYQRPEAARTFNSIAQYEFGPSEDLAKAAALSLRESNLFKDAFFTFGGEKEKADLLLEGEIVSTTYRGSVWSYGLSFEGPLLWLFGLPAGTSRNQLELKLAMKDLATGQTLWQKTYQKETKVTQGLYYKFGHDARGYSYLTQEIMNDAVEELGRTLKEKNVK